MATVATAFYNDRSSKSGTTGAMTSISYTMTEAPFQRYFSKGGQVDETEATESRLC
ncbi:hypothetical protein PAXRUDRAFT_833019 [Paxillus rubicundulus Ve08.2h10]|uniref:Uncharacterized protein n=1 Tax=Paxillus rubicundulus Ve08.2h10 TaxID=930991 RepID=A0A0D0DPY9_9AGAM|nr:hypothetical protein PAXRUDRAFT_833019 [Paxillus rubicundulus Ve08.2h10]